MWRNSDPIRPPLRSGTAAGTTGQRRRLTTGQRLAQALFDRAGPLARLVAEKTAVMNQWIKDGRIEPIDPPHFIFAIWAVTQHYADFAVQVEAVMRGKPPRAATKKAVLQLLLHGIIKKDR